MITGEMPKSNLRHINRDNVAHYEELKGKVLEFFQKNNQEALRYALNALDVAQKINDAFIKSEALHHITLILRHSGRYKQAIKYANESIALLEELDKPNPIYHAKLYNGLGIIYKDKGEFESALYNFIQALDLIENEEGNGVATQRAGIFMNIAVIHNHNNLFDKSISYLNRALSLMEQANSIKGVLYCYITYGNIYSKRKDYHNAERYYLKALQLTEQDDNLSQLKAAIYNNLSIVAEHRKDYKLALAYSHQSLQIKQKLRNVLPIAISYHRIGYITCILDNVEEGLHYLLLSLDLTKEIGAKAETVAVLERIALVYEGLGDYKKAYEFLKEHNKIKTSVFGEERAQTIAEMEMKHELEKKEREAEILRKAQEKIQVYADKLEQSNRELEQFARVTSHDLKEPLRMVSSYLGLIKRKMATSTDTDMQTYLGFAVDGAKRMTHLINDILDLAKVSTTERPFEQVNLNETIFAVTQNILKTLEEKNAELLIDALPEVTGDYFQLIQLFQNLISNGLKYNQNEHPKVEVIVIEKEEHYQFEIRDNGIGIPEEHFERVFMMLQRLHKRGEYSGTGIGLAVCKKIAERHGGEIWVTSKVNEGSSFWFTISKQLGNHISEEN